jgi:hypothetical protein
VNLVGRIRSDEKEKQMPLTFVVGTPRSGGTMLARILNMHPDVLCVNEFVANLMRQVHERAFPISVMDGAELWRMLELPYHFFDAAIRDGLPYPELCYPYDRGRFDPASGPLHPGAPTEVGKGVPIISHSTLPMLTDDPDGLFDALAAEVPTWPARPAADQYRELFGFLARQLGRTVVVERSSTSMALAPLLRGQFPEARFVHLHRDGPDCALALSRHPLYRMSGFHAEAIRAAGLTSWDEIEAEVRRLFLQGKISAEFNGLIAWPFDAKRFTSYEIPLPFFGGIWSRMMTQGLESLGDLPADAWTAMAYENLLGSPRDELTRLASYIGVEATPQWLDAASELIATRQAGEAAALNPGVLTALRKSCEPGTLALRASEERRRGSEKEAAATGSR